MKKKELLDILADERIYGVLEEVMKNDDLYISAQKEHDMACEELERARLDKDQNRIVDRVISTANHCGAIYGAIAYRQGLYDGIELVAELK